MRKELLEFIASVKKDTPLTEIQRVCENMDEVLAVLKYVPLINDWEDEPLEAPDKELAIRAYEEFKDFPIAELTTKEVMKRLCVGYPNACKVVEWLKKSL